MRNDYYYDEIERKNCHECLMIISNYVIANAFKNFRLTSIMYTKHCFSVCANSTLLDME